MISLTFRYSALTVAVFLFLTSNIIAQNSKMSPKDTEVWEPKPKKIEAPTNAPPSDAIVLFNGSSLSKWKSTDGGAAPWVVNGNHFTVKPGTGNIETKKQFGDIQLHIEWRIPSDIEGEGQERGNSGIFLQQRYEVQVLGSFNNRTYSNGMAGSIYKQHIPKVNATREPGKWQVYDIIFKAPKFDNDGSLESPARMTVFLNGVLIHYNAEIEGRTEYIGLPKYESYNSKGPLVLQDHSNKVSYRNIWVREIDLDVN